MRNALAKYFAPYFSSYSSSYSKRYSQSGGKSAIYIIIITISLYLQSSTFLFINLSNSFAFDGSFEGSYYKGGRTNQLQSVSVHLFSGVEIYLCQPGL